MIDLVIDETSTDWSVWYEVFCSCCGPDVGARRVTVSSCKCGEMLVMNVTSGRQNTRSPLTPLHICQCLYELPSQYKTQTNQPSASVLSQAPACVESEVRALERILWSDWDFDISVCLIVFSLTVSLGSGQEETEDPVAGLEKNIPGTPGADF